MGNLYTFLWKGKEKEKEITTTYLGAITLRFHFLYHSSGGAAHYLTRRLKSSRNACLPRFTGLALIDRRGVHVAERRWPRNGDKLLACNCRLRGYYRSSFFPSGYRHRSLSTWKHATPLASVTVSSSTSGRMFLRCFHIARMYEYVRVFSRI